MIGVSVLKLAPADPIMSGENVIYQEVKSHGNA